MPKVYRTVQGLAEDLWMTLLEEAVAHLPDCGPGSPGTQILEEGNVGRLLVSLI